MVSLGGLSRTVDTTKNFWTALLLKFSDSEKTIVFRNGMVFKTDWTQYCLLRDSIANLGKLSLNIEKSSEKYRIWGTKPKFEFSFTVLKQAYYFSYFLSRATSKGWIINQNSDLLVLKKQDECVIIRELEDNSIFTEFTKFKMITPVDSLIVLLDESEAYECACRGKTVLDVGAYCGETAVFFWSRGARKLVIYEPVQSHHTFIRRNVEINSIDAEIHEEGIGREDGVMTVNFEAPDQEFGLSSTGRNQIEIKVRKTEDVIIKSGAQVAKFDCEGAEVSLIEVPDEVLRKVETYIIETHNDEIQQTVTKKLIGAGFVETHSPRIIAKGVAILRFEKA